MPYSLSQPQIDDLTGLAQANEWASFYNRIFLLTASSDTEGMPIDAPVRDWFRAATSANAGVGAESDLIRDYTQAQIFQRTGQLLTDSQMQAASDALASQIFQVYVQSGTLPTLNQIAQLDAQVIVDSVNESLGGTGNVFDVDIWSGNLLFVGLGQTEPLESNLLGTSNNTYDIFAAAASLSQAGLGALVGSGWNAFWSNLSLPVSSAASAASKIDSFLTQAYGDLAPTSIDLFGLGSTLVGKQNSSSDTFDLIGPISQSVYLNSQCRKRLCRSRIWWKPT